MEEDADEETVAPMLATRAMRLATRSMSSRLSLSTTTSVEMGAGTEMLQHEHANDVPPLLPQTGAGVTAVARGERNDSGGAASTREAEAWGAGDDEDGWMPKPARLHSGKTRVCVVCSALLQYASAPSWDEYLQSEEYLTQLQANVLQDVFVSALICGDSTAADLPTEHRMHKNRKLKCRQSVRDYRNMTSAGVVDQAGKEKGSIRTLEEMLLDALPTPVFTHVLERRLAVISHSATLACQLMRRDDGQKCARPVEVAPASEELHHVAIHTLSALLGSFDYANAQALQSFQELSRLLTYFPVLSLYSFWSPTKKAPDKPLRLAQDAVDVSSITSNSRSHGAYCAVDGTASSYWQSEPRPGPVYFHVRSNELPKVEAVVIQWHLKQVPHTVVVQYRPPDSDTFVQLAEVRPVSPSGPTRIATRFPPSCLEMRLVLLGTPASNREGTVAIQHLQLNVPASTSLFVDPETTLNDVAKWLLGALALDNTSEELAAEVIGALRAWALSTASLGVTLLFVEMLLNFSFRTEVAKRPRLARFALEQGQVLCDGIKAYRMEEALRLRREEETRGIGDVQRVQAFFEASVCSSGVCVEDGGLVVRTRETSYQYAAVNCGIATGKASWKFRLDNDTQDDEMTCFGAAVLPVSVNGYDSSPSLWMLRGYNGNLYGRGHKLGRSIGKVHPGDTVQVTVDMGEGTLAYKINGTDYGVVFTDLAGLEVYPAVSFYGSGKVITLLSVQKWDCTNSGSDVEPVFLSSMNEYHFSVGYGTLGKGGLLGYASDADSRASPAAVPHGGSPGVSSTIQIDGDAKQRCLSTHPPTEGDAYVSYDLAEAYHLFCGSVAINDDARNETLQQLGVAVVFKVLGDGVVLWQSEPISEIRKLEAFEVSVKEVRMLELKASCVGSNHCAHAVWVDPCLYPVEEWPCAECSFVNKGVTKVCTVCQKGTRESSAKSVSMVSGREGAAVLSDGPKASISNTVGGDFIANPQTLGELSTTIIRQVHDLYQLQAQRASSVGSAVGGTLSGLAFKKASVQFEEPFCRQPNKDVFWLLLSILRRFRDACFGAAGDVMAGCSEGSIRDACVHVLGIISANLESIDRHDVKDPEAELGMSREMMAKLRGELETIASVHVSSELYKMHMTEDIEIAAAQTIVSGISVLYPSPGERLELLLQLLRGYIDRPFDPTSARYFMLSALMHLLASPGRSGALTFMPYLVDEYGVSGTASSSDWNDISVLLAVNEVIDLLMKVVVNSHRMRLARGTNSSDAGSCAPVRNPDELPKVAMRLLRTYQLYLLAEAVELTKTNVEDNAESDNPDKAQAWLLSQRRSMVQEATIQFGFLSLNSYRDLIETLIEVQAEEAFLFTQPAAALQANVRAYSIPLLSEVLPWFVSCLCLLRRQTWLARPILPAVTRFLGTLDHYCSDLELVSKSAQRLQQLEAFQNARTIERQQLEIAAATERDAGVRSHPSKRLYNVFRELYTGEKDHFEGQIGFQFEATSSFSIVALGRSVSPSKNGGRLLREHTIRLWEEGSQVLIGHVVVSGSSKKDALGYALEPLAATVRITQGKLYRLTTQEFANGGDPWYKKENLPDEEYDESFIKILRDCYASGSVGFPGSQNMVGAAYGVPTFLVQDEAPLSSLPQFVPPHGCLPLKFNAKHKLNSVDVSHSGASVHAKDGSDTWRTCFLRTAFLHGVHSVDFALKGKRAAGTVSGHICIGVDWPPKSAAISASAYSSLFDSFLGASYTSIGWMPSIGAVWVQGQRFDYGPQLPITAGDIFTLVMDYDLQHLSFAYNGKDLGIAVGRTEFQPTAMSMTRLPEVMNAGVSLYGSEDIVEVRPSGVAKSTLRIHWLFDLHNSLASLAGRIASTLIAGHPVDTAEEELLPWLQSPLLSGGVAGNGLDKEDSGLNYGTGLPLSWKAALRTECDRYPSSGEAPRLSLLADLSEDPAAGSGNDVLPRKRGSSGRSNVDDVTSQREKKFWETWTEDMTEKGSVQLILMWLEKNCPDRTFLSRLGKFPLCERWVCAALIKHAPSHVLHEVYAIAEGAKETPTDQDNPLEFFVAHSSLTPSDDLIQVWKRVVALRHWMIRARQEYRAREADEAEEGEKLEVPVQSDGSSSSLRSAGSGTASPKRLQESIDLEKSLVVPKTFKELVSQVSQRSQFLCMLAPPSEEADRVKGDSQLALSNLAEKWSAQKTPPSLQPMLERWKTLRESDSSKWSGIVDVLRAQHRWRARRASIRSLVMPSPEMKAPANPTQTDGDEAIDTNESDDDVVAAAQRDYENSFSAMMKACDLYIRNGIGAPPEVLQALLERRQRRSDSRLFGLQALKSIVSLLSYDSAIHSTLIFLRPAMRGFTDGEKESRELNDGQVVAETFRATVRHHYLKGLEGCNRQTMQTVQAAFCELYSYLAQLLSGNSGHHASDPQLKQAILCAWSLDFEPRDHQFLLETGILSKLQELFSISSVLREAVVDQAHVTTPKETPRGAVSRNSAGTYSSINWHPLPEEFVQRGLLHSGYLTKRDVVRLLHRAPPYACPVSWWKKNELEFGDGLVSPASRHTASSLSLAYSEMLAGLQSKLAGIPCRTVDTNVLQFGSKISPASVRGSSGSQNSKPEEISYVETPALGEVQSFTLELWVYPTELSGYRSLRCDNGLQDGSAYVELIDGRVELAIPGNSPREVQFTAHRLRTHEWAHIAVVYDGGAKRSRLYVNGIIAGKKSFERVCKSVTLRDARIGCWMSRVDTQGAPLTNVAAQRKFKGFIAEVRVWRVPRPGFAIRRDFQRSVPFTTDRFESSLSHTDPDFSDLIVLWHLNEGKGIRGYDRAKPESNTDDSTEPVDHHSTVSHCRWVSMEVPVFGGGSLDAVSPEKWARTVSGVCCLQRKVRGRLLQQMDSSVRLSKLVCEHEERVAIRRWSREEDEEEEETPSDDDDAYLNDGDPINQDGVASAASEPLDEATSALIAQWSTCTDEHIIIRKQTRRCAWIVFRFLASTGISGTYERREDEAKSVAAVAKMKRKQRLQKAGLLSSVDSPRNSRLPGTPKADAARAPGLSYSNDDVGSRTAEAASDAAKSAATNRELEEPVLQTLWFSVEFHRKVFEVLEKELLQGKELAEDAEGLTRAQRMLRSASTPVQKRGVSLHTHPSYVAPDKTGFVNNLHHAPSDLSANSELLEPLEVEMHMFGVLSFMLSQSGQSSALTHLVRPRMLRGLLEMLRLASPRSQRLVKLLLRRICCNGSISPSDVSTILGSDSVLVDLLLDQVAESVCSTAAPLPTHAANVPAVNRIAGATDVGDSVAIAESLCNPMGFRSGQISLVMASESVALLRLLLMEKKWQTQVTTTLCNAIRNVAPTLARQKTNSSTDGADRARSSDIRIQAAIVRAVGALCVLGSYSDCIRVGGKVNVPAQGTESNAADPDVDYGSSFVVGDGQSVSATLIEMNAKASTVRVVFDPSSKEFDPSHNVQNVSLSSLSPIEEIRLPNTAVPLTLDMMPVILKLSSLEGTSIWSEFDNLWGLQIRSRALLALEALLRSSLDITKSIAREAMARNLFLSALTPVSLSSFVSLPQLQERGRMILCRLIESSTPLGPAMFRSLGDPKKPSAVNTSSDDAMSGSSEVEANENPAEEESEAHRVRRGFASTLAAMGFEFDLCMAALEHTRNDPNMAVEWLMGAGAAEYQEQQQAQRLVQASIEASGKAGGGDGVPGLTLEAKAEELQGISGMPYCVALGALELSNSDPNRAMEWLMEHGNKYVEQPDSLELLTDAFHAAKTVVLEDRAAMEEIDQPDPLVTTPSRHKSSTKVSSTSSSGSSDDNMNAMAATLAPILAPVPGHTALTSGVSSPREGHTTGCAPLDPNYLPPHVLLTVSSDVGSVPRLVASGRTGIYRRFSPNDGVLITFLNTESGAFEDEWHLPRDVRRIVKVYDEPLDGIESIHRVALRTENALSTHYARRAITALLRAFDPVAVASSTARAPDRSMATPILEEKPPSPLASFSDDVLNMVGGPRQFVTLLKLVAASEMTVAQQMDSDRGIRATATSASMEGGSDALQGDGEAEFASGSLLRALQRITLRILHDEAQSGKLETTKWAPLHSPSRVSNPSTATAVLTVPENVPSALQVSLGEALVYTADEDDEALNQAIALSMEEAAGSSPPPAPTAISQRVHQHDGASEEENLRYPQRVETGDEEEKHGEPVAIRGTRLRQPSDTEAQEVASAYLGGGVDDHDGLLSSVLVKECVSHFVESTRVAGDGECEPQVVQEFQSLHPYFGRCEYARAVSIDSSFHCLRVVFDHRCRFGAKAKLTFFSDPECEDRIGVLDSDMTASGHLIPDLVIHSHQFWFRFAASEDDAAKDNGYGYRFQVKPMASIQWTKEDEVLTNPSLEWACWVLELLLNDATELVAGGAVHNRKIYGALVRYLRSPGAPFKGRVVRLLVQLLHRPELFPANEVPELDTLESIAQLALTRAENDKARGKVFLSAHLLQFVELSMVLSTASTVFERTLRGETTASKLTVPTPLSLPRPFDEKSMRECLNDVSELTSFLLGKTTRLGPHILVAIWLEVYGSAAIIESSHPYAASVPQSGSVTFEGAQALQVAFDSRCALTPEHTSARLELASYSLVAKSESASTVSSGWIREIRSNRTYAGEESWPEDAVLLDGDELNYSFQADDNGGGRFGFATTVAAIGLPREKQLARATCADLERLLGTLVAAQSTEKSVSTESDNNSEAVSREKWTRSMDLQLVDWVNAHVEPTTLLAAPAVSASRRLVDLLPSDVRLHHTLDALRCSTLLGLPLEALQLRFALLKYLNQSLQTCLPLLDLRDTQASWTLAHRLRQLSHCVFFDVKNALVDAGIEATNVPGDSSSSQTARITLDRLQALESRDDREVEPSVSECFFAQAFRQLRDVDPALLRRQIDNKGRLFSVKFRGEEGVDWGGVYREGATSMVDDLFSPHLGLFVLCPNGQHDTGGNRGMYLPNPKCTSPVAMHMFVFVGQLLGISLRTRGDLPFLLAPLVWKQLLGQPLERADLEGTDAMFVQMLDGIANCERDGIATEDEFATAFAGLDLRFTASSCTGEELELVPGGRQRHVDFHNRLEYCRLAERARLTEGQAQVAAMARGFATLFPRRVLTLLTWQELELLTCGSPKIDLDVWKRHTRYDGYREDDETVLLFWEALADFSDEQRADFVRFAWGRSRLPRGKWPQPFKLSKKSGRDATRSLPVAHTCFFSVELPPYTSRETMRSMLLATITFGLGGILMA